jgi:hypothetical protein
VFHPTGGHPGNVAGNVRVGVRRECRLTKQEQQEVLDDRRDAGRGNDTLHVWWNWQ